MKETQLRLHDKAQFIRDVPHRHHSSPGLAVPLDMGVVDDEDDLRFDAIFLMSVSLWGILILAAAEFENADAENDLFLLWPVFFSFLVNE